MPQEMKAVVMYEHGGPEVLRLERVPVPDVAPDELLIKVHAVSINRSFDILVRQDGNGRKPNLPLVLGADPAGDVVAVGADVPDFAVGDRVVVESAYSCGHCDLCKAGRFPECVQRSWIGVHRWGGYAEYAAIPARLAHKIPAALGYAEATIVQRHFPTAFALALKTARLKAGETALVMGAAGALGSCLVQVAKLTGATVIGAAGADDRVAAVIEFGADFGINYRSQDLAEEVMRITGGRGVDVVFENIADPTLWPGAFNSLAWDGRLATIGSHGGGTVPLNVRKLYNQRLSILGGVRLTSDDMELAYKEASAGHLRMLIGATFPLEEARRAHEVAAANAVPGKVIISPSL